jgi:GMP synthase-like glutamine amidotransferase
MSMKLVGCDNITVALALCDSKGTPRVHENAPDVMQHADQRRPVTFRHLHSTPSSTQTRCVHRRQAWSVMCHPEEHVRNKPLQVHGGNGVAKGPFILRCEGFLAQIAAKQTDPQHSHWWHRGSVGGCQRQRENRVIGADTAWQGSPGGFAQKFERVPQSHPAHGEAAVKLPLHVRIV